MVNIEQMRVHMLNYFAAEKNAGVLLIFIGLAAVIASVIVFYRIPIYRGMVIPLALVAAIQIAAGGAVLSRSSSQAESLEASLAAERTAFKSEELSRMDGVMRNLTLRKAVEIAMLLAGIALTFAFKGRNFAYSLGIGLIAQPSIMLILDLFAQKRAEIYIKHLQSLL